MVQAFRGVGKSWLTAAFVVWKLLVDPQRKILVVSQSGEYAATMSVFIKRLIDELPECYHLRPRQGQRTSNVAFDVGPAKADKVPSVRSTGVNGQYTGSRAHDIVADDVEVPKNVYTQLMRTRLSEQVKEFDDLLVSDQDADGNKKPTEELPTITFLGTPQSEVTTYADLPTRGYDVRIWPARIPEDLARYCGRLAPFVLKMIEGGAKAWTPVDPRRFDNRALRSKERSAGRSRFALQYMLDTTLADALKYPLKHKDLMVLALDKERGPVALAWAQDPNRTLINDLQSCGFTGDSYYSPGFISEDWAEWQNTVLSIDPSGMGEDETGWVVLRMLHARLFVVAAGGFKGGYSPENLKALADLAKDHKVNSVLIEKNFGGGMFAALLKPQLTKIYPCTITEVDAVGQKEVRIIDTLEPVMNQHRLVIDRSVIEKELEEQSPAFSLMFQMSRLTKERGALEHDDRLDALAHAVKHFQTQMASDTEDAAETQREQVEREFFERYVDSMNNPLLGHNGGPALGDYDFDEGNGRLNWNE